MGTVTIVVATFGSAAWEELGDRTVDHAEREAPDEIVRVHGDSLAEARNTGAMNASSEWLCFLDAGDVLEPRYLDVLATPAVDTAGDLRAPRLRLVPPGIVPESVIPLDLRGRDMDTINPCCIGTLVRRSMFLDVGGFWPERAWEDWSLFRRCWLLGATIVHHGDAVYRAHVNPTGRNSTVDRPAELHQQIRSSHQQWLRHR